MMDRDELARAELIGKLVIFWLVFAIVGGFLAYLANAYGWPKEAWLGIGIATIRAADGAAGWHE